MRDDPGPAGLGYSVTCPLPCQGSMYQSSVALLNWPLPPIIHSLPFQETTQGFVRPWKGACPLIIVQFAPSSELQTSARAAVLLPEYSTGAAAHCPQFAGVDRGAVVPAGQPPFSRGMRGPLGRGGRGEHGGVRPALLGT